VLRGGSVVGVMWLLLGVLRVVLGRLGWVRLGRGKGRGDLGGREGRKKVHGGASGVHLMNDVLEKRRRANDQLDSDHSESVRRWQVVEEEKGSSRLA
jgi:hypothetical protein